MAATRRLLERNGILAGLNLREVAAEAGVNPGQIYQYFGNRRALLRAAITELLTDNLPPLEQYELAFVERKRAIWQWALEHADIVKLIALLALDGDQADLFPRLELTRESLERDQASGDLPAEADALIVHSMTCMLYYGYSLFRRPIASRLGIPLEQLDQRSRAVYDVILSGLTRVNEQRGSATSPNVEPGENLPL